jgi:hypothetical protein
MPDELDDERVHQVLQSLAGPPVDSEEALRAVHAGARAASWRRRLAPVVAAAAAAVLVAVVLIRAGRDGDGDDVVPAAPSTEQSSITTPLVTPSVAPSTIPPTVPPTTEPVVTASTVPPTAASAAPPPPTNPPATNPPAAPSATTKEFRCPGGTVTVRVTGQGLVLVSAVADPGFGVADQSVRANRVEVVFVTGGDDNEDGGEEREIRVRLDDGELRHECRD